LIAVAACAAMDFGIHIGLLLRAYSLIFTVTLLAWWLGIRYIRRPTLFRGMALGLTAALMFYLHVTSIFALLVLGIFTLILYPHRVWHWWLPAVIIGILIVPEAISKFSLASGKAGTGVPILQQWLAGGATVLFQQIERILRDFAGYGISLWSALMIIAATVILDRYHKDRRTLALVVWVLAPILLFFTSLFDAYNNRHLAWVMPGFALWIGWGFSRLPRSAITGLMAIFVLLMFGPVPIAERYTRHKAPLVSSFSFLQYHAKSGDVVVIDPNTPDISPEEWDYYVRAYFPRGVEFVTNPGSHRRVWYAAFEGQQTPSTADLVYKNRTQLLRTGDDSFAVKLYEAPPNLTGIAFENGMRFHGIEALDTYGPAPVWREGQTVRVRLWWSAIRQIDLDYSEAVFIFGEGRVIAQSDGAPQVMEGPRETSRWVTDRYYVEEREITLPSPLNSGVYPLSISVYQWWDNKRLSAPGMDENKLLPVMSIRIKSW
jgi:hypothetical protein